MSKPLYFTWGGDFKSINDEGILEGKAIVFGSETDHDISQFKDFFNSNTFVHCDDTFSVPLFLEHGFKYTKPIGKAIISRGETGWDTVAQLDMKNPVVKERFSDIKKGGWGFSTGAVGHVVEREQKSNNTHEITQWCVGELSITKTPAEPKALVHNVKSISEYYDFDENVNEYEVEDHTNSISELIALVKVQTDLIKVLIENINAKSDILIKTDENELLSVLKKDIRLDKSIDNEESTENVEVQSDELTVLKSDNEKLKSDLLELQSSFDEKEALLSEKIVLLSETQAQLDVKSQEVTVLEEALKEENKEVASLKQTIKNLTSNIDALVKTNYKL